MASIAFSTPQSNPRERLPPRKRELVKKRKWADLMDTCGQFTWPSVGNSMATYGQFFMATDNPDSIADPRVLAVVQQLKRWRAVAMFSLRIRPDLLQVFWVRMWAGDFSTKAPLARRRQTHWALADHMRTDLIQDALQMALVLRGERPASVIFHSDRGTQYASAQITEFATANRIIRSMGYTGICWDKAMAESFFATLKTEFYYRRVWPTRAHAIRDVSAWIEDRYNRRRRHSSIGNITPVDFEMQYSTQAAEIQLAA